MAFVLAPIGSWIFRQEDLAALIGREALFWALTLIIVAYILFVERRPLSSVSWRAPRSSSILIGVAGAALTIAGMALIYLAVFPALQLSQSDGDPVTLSTPLWFMVALVLRAAIFEELFFRGFMIERLTEITNSRWLAAALSLAAFTFSHLGGWGPAHLIIAGFGGFVLTALYLWRRDLVTNMVAHFLTNAVGLMLR
jgi:membrane protease YdiL (CAAX protease family)